MKVVKNVTYDVFTDAEENKLIETAIVELEEVLKMFNFAHKLAFRDIDCNYVEVTKDEVMNIRNLLEVLMANEVEVADR